MGIGANARAVLRARIEPLGDCGWLGEDNNAEGVAMTGARDRT